jgi:Ca2+-binding EF-hand superfamily protein
VVTGWLIGGALFLVAGGSAGAETPGAALASPTAAIVFAPSRPVFLQLVVEIDGGSLESFRERFAARWFERLDQNKDGNLNEKEAAGFPASANAGDEQSSEQKIWPELDVDPADGKGTLAEFRKFLIQRLGLPLLLIEKKRTGNTARELFERLDLNGDLALSGEELSTARQCLARLDANDDETVSVAELSVSTEDSSEKKSDASASDRLPLLLIVPDINVASVAARLLRAYDGQIKPPADGALDPAELGVSIEAIRPLDADGNGKLNADELAQLIRKPPVPSKLQAELFDQQRGRAKIEAESNSSAGLPWQTTSEGTSIKLDAFQITFGVKRTRGSTADNRSFYALRFRIIDKDKNNYLDAAEFAKLDLTGAEFKAVDADGNGQVVADELSAFVGRQEMAPVNQVVIEIADESRSLFDFLDTRTDGRLGPRELNSAKSRLSELDGDKDGRITMGELTTQVNIEFSVKRPAVERRG